LWKIETDRGSNDAPTHCSGSIGNDSARGQSVQVLGIVGIAKLKHAKPKTKLLV